MKVEIKPGFLFPTQYWTAEFNQDIKELQKELPNLDVQGSWCAKLKKKNNDYSNNCLNFAVSDKYNKCKSKHKRMIFCYCDKDGNKNVGVSLYET